MEKSMKLKFAFVEEVRQYTYRTVYVWPAFFQINRRSPEWTEIEEKLAEASGRPKDNHTVYSVKSKGSYLHFWCTDSTVYVGSELIVEPN